MGAVVIPTRFDRESLWPLIAAAEPSQVVLVHTEPGHDDVGGVINVHDYRRNIHHWWNTGLDAARGPALILNDDVSLSRADFGRLRVALQSADLVYVPGRRRTAPSPISGWCFGLRPDVLRPDTGYTWWCGDDDLYQRATARALRVQRVDVTVTHIDRGGFGPPPEFTDAVQADRARYARKWTIAS